MPEIIEAEITKQKLALAVKGKRILDFWTDCPRGFISKFKNPEEASGDLRGIKVKNLERKGKVILLNLEGDKVLAIHQRMSGHLRLAIPGVASKSKHEHFKWSLSDGISFSLVDPRKFGVVWYGSKNWLSTQPYFKSLGKDVLSIQKKEFLELLVGRSHLKSFLLRQDKFAGLGNIACDEILWHARLNPKRKVDSLSKNEMRSLYNSLFCVLASVLNHGGTSMSDWQHPDGVKGNYQKAFKVYKQNICKRCKQPIIKTKLSSRSSYFCKFCQKI